MTWSSRFLSDLVPQCQPITAMDQFAEFLKERRYLLNIPPAYWNWAGEPHHLKYLKEEQKALATLNGDQVQRIIRVRPKGRNLCRAHLLALILLDTGLRFSEALASAVSHVSWRIRCDSKLPQQDKVPDFGKVGAR